MSIVAMPDSTHGESALEHAGAYLVAQIEEPAPGSPAAAPHVPGPAITIARETGSGGQEVAERLSERLQELEPEAPAKWTVFNHRLIEQVLEDHHLPAELAPLVPEDRRSGLQERAADLLGLRSPTWKLIPDIVDTIRRLVESGRVIIIGRGCNVITAGTPNVFHVRLVAPRGQRVEHVRRVRHASEEDANRILDREDRGRARYMRSYFGREIDDPLLYHLVVNTGRMSYDEAARLIADGAEQLFARRRAAGG